MEIFTSPIVSILLGFVIGIIVILIYFKINTNKSKTNALKIIEDAQTQAKNIIKQANLDGKTEVHELKLQAEKDINKRNKEIDDKETSLFRREELLNIRDNNLIVKEKKLDQEYTKITEKNNKLDKLEEELKFKIDSQIVLLEKVSNLSQEEARAQILDVVEKKVEQEAALIIKEKLEEAEEKAQDKAKNILALAISKYSQEESLERTISVVQLPNDEIKGRLIGREGRNIRVIEQATGVDLLVDDTPEVVTLSCFNPIRREVAKIALESLIKDGRIQPGRIEEAVKKAQDKIEEMIMKYGEETCFKLKIGKLDKELVRLIGTMRYRYSYGQNGLEHIVEVASFAGYMASELGLNVQLAKRAGLLHDIGKALDFEQEGTHVELGARICRKHNENEVVINAIESHHGDKAPTSIYSYLVHAADTLSAARPGARHQNMENYIERIENLEKLANEFDGVEKSYAIQAGREIRVFVVPERVNDDMCSKIAFDLKEKIEKELTYPGQIKVNVIRETRKSEIAK